MAKKDTPILSLRHAFKYTFTEPVTVAELVDSLKGYEKLVVTFLPRILNAVLETEVCGIIVRVEEVEQGSLIEKFIFDLLFKDEQSYRQFIDAVRKFSGVDDAHEGNYMRLISVFIAVLLVAGAGYMLGNINQKQALQQDIITIINADGGNSRLSGEDMIKIVEAVSSTDKKTVAQNTSKVIRPAQIYHGNIEIGEEKNAIKPFSKNTLQVLPQKVDIKDDPLSTPYKDIDVQIRASDRDKSTGWFGIIDGVIERRVRLILPTDIDKDAVANNATIRADVIVFYKINKDGEKEALNITIERLVD